MSQENVQAEQQAFNEALALLNRRDVEGFIEMWTPNHTGKPSRSSNPSKVERK
jgi:hypothetical protein